MHRAVTTRRAVLIAPVFKMRKQSLVNLPKVTQPMRGCVGTRLTQEVLLNVDFFFPYKHTHSY